MNGSSKRALWALVPVAFLWACGGAGEQSDAAEAVAESAAIAATAPETVEPVRAEGEIEGQVVDVSCYVAQGLSGDSHRQCAEICANDLGIPLNILDDDGNLWALVDDDMPGHDQNPTVVQFAEQRVRASGTLIEKGPNRAIIVKNVALVEGTPHPEALEASTNPELGRTFNTKPAANPCAAKDAGAANPCAAKNPCAANPCAAKNPCAPQS